MKVSRGPLLRTPPEPASLQRRHLEFLKLAANERWNDPQKQPPTLDVLST